LRKTSNASTRHDTSEISSHDPILQSDSQDYNASIVKKNSIQQIS